MTLPLTGECCIPGRSPARIVEDHVARYRFAARWVRDRTVLDIACGTGYGSQLLAEAGAARVDGVDVAPATLDYACAHHVADGLCFRTGDIATCQAEAPYQVITCFETIEHVIEYEAALANLRRLLAPGGRLLISSPNRPVTSPLSRSLADRPSNVHHVREFTIPELTAALARHGLSVIADGVYGQRQQRWFDSRHLRTLYKKLFRPNVRSSPAVAPLRPGRVPRYFTLIAEPTDANERSA